MTTNQTIDGVDRKIQEGELVMSTERIRKEFEVFRKEAIAAFARMGFPNPDRCIRDTASLWSGWQAGWQAAIETMKNPRSQADGEPVHQCHKCNGRGAMPTRHAGEGETDYRARCKLYAEQPAPVVVALPDRDTLRDIIAQVIGGDTYDCTRVWSAWSVGTMSDDDFVPVVDQEARLYEITDACLEEFTRLNAQ